jgi:hypothetical protein
VVIGHPGIDEEQGDIAALILGGAYDIKRVMPGKYVGMDVELTRGHQVHAAHDDASTIGRDSGAAVIDPQTGRLLGVRFFTSYLSRAACVPAWELARDPEVTRVGIEVFGTPAPQPDWMSAWTPSTNVRPLLLDAYVAWQGGDQARAKSALDAVPRSSDPPADLRRRYRSANQVDRALLEAAMLAGENSDAAGTILEELVDHVPTESWSAADRDAAIATRLRLAVDAEAEVAFLELLYWQPEIARLVLRTQFRVLAPPSDELPWGTHAYGGLEALHPPKSPEALAERIILASERCLRLETWASNTGRQLTDLGYLLNSTSARTYRELVAAHVAFPAVLAVPLNMFLLEKVELEPHPTKGWAPILKPLWMLFRDVVGRLPDGMTTVDDVQPWLETRARSGRLGAYLSELLRLDSPTAWAAGLLHLLTPLPLDALLQRHFTSTEST